jgi:hypothetical protein
MRRTALLSIAVAVLLAAPVAAQGPPEEVPWNAAQSLEEYRSWSLEHKIEIYRQVVAHAYFTQWNGRRLAHVDARDPSRGGYDELLTFLPLSPQDMLKIDMLLRHYEVAIPRVTHELHQRWLSIHFGAGAGPGQSDATAGDDHIVTDTPIAWNKATVATNRNSAYLYSTTPDDYDGEIQVAVNPFNASQIVSMSNTWGDAGDPSTCSLGTQAIFFSSDGGDSWGYTCAPRGSMYEGLSCSGEEFGSDPALAWDDQGNVFGEYMSLCLNSSGTAVSGYAMVVAKSTDGGATWSPHGVLKNSYSSGSVEDKNFYIIDTHPTSPYFRRHYSCWDRANDELIRYSTDGGVTWNETNLPDPSGGLDLGCEMAVEDDGTLHVIFDNLTCGIFTCSDEDMYYTRSPDGGISWSSLVHVRDITDPISFGANAAYGPQDERGLNPFGAIDVDNSGGICDGYLYVTFTDDADADGVGTADIWVTRSPDGGATWEPAIRVNDTPDPDTSIQFHPFLVVDQSSGAIVVTWHDARNDPDNRAVDFYVAQSTDCGQTWTNVQASQNSDEFNNSDISYTNLNSSDNGNSNPNQYGEYMGLDVLDGVAYVAWTDSRHFFPGSDTEPQKENVGFTTVVFCQAEVPENVNASVLGDNAIRLSWDLATGATEYRVYRSTTSAGGYTQLATVAAPTTSYVDNSVEGGLTYYYVVSSYNQSEVCETAYSPPASATATGLCDLAPSFAGLSSAASNGRCAIDLSWAPADSICGGSVDYSVYRSTSIGFTPSLATRIAAGISGTSYTDGSGVSSDTTYAYIVRATDLSNGQEDSNTVELYARPTAPTVVDGTWFAGAEPGDPVMYTNGSWTISSARFSTPSRSYHSGYSDNLCAYLKTPAVTLTAGQSSELSYRTAWDIENRFDGGVVEISTDGGATWKKVTPSPGYPGSFRDASNACGYPRNEPAYTGTNKFTFKSYTVSLAAYDGQDVMVRWNLSTDGAITEEGWYIDDITITHAQVPGSCDATPSDVPYLTARSTSGHVKLEWVNPSVNYDQTRICRDTTSYPTDPTACTAVYDSGAYGAGNYGTYTDDTVSDGTTYYYTAWVDNGSGLYSGGVNAWARPFDSSGKVKWSYSSAASSLAPPGVFPGAIGAGGVWAVSNDRLLHGTNPTADGGDWLRTAPFSWVPMAMNAPAQARPPIVPTTAVPGASKVIFLGSEDGHVYAVDAQGGEEPLWQSPKLGSILFASPSGIFTRFGGSWDLLFIGTRDATADNIMYALNPADGTVEDQFDNGGGANGIGIISSGATVDYDNNRIYFASRARAGGSQDTLWCLSFSGAGFTKEWSMNLGDIDGAPVLYQGRLYVGNNDGTVYAVDPINPIDNEPIWSYDASGDGAVKGFVTPEDISTFPRRLYFSTTDNVWSITDNGDHASAGWESAVDGASVPLAPFGENVLYVGSSDGRLHQLNAATGGDSTSVVLGDGRATVGSPTRDYVNNMAYVGSESGAVYGVELPLQ